uniref:Zinc finger protein n=1 Tax=Ciona intestinalis TaxID=7719 RepID=Q1RLC5_CIOIN|nr:zinc finger protein ZF(C3H)-13 [Ciona intestinalis]FAA00140.1 TPA: zinc finger protein [Ciona intestinalis]|eukprot:NP_001123327.1 zinc finger protein ZF(C3H)-13 [Ciona intestinalis]
MDAVNWDQILMRSVTLKYKERRKFIKKTKRKIKRRIAAAETSKRCDISGTDIGTLDSFKTTPEENGNHKTLIHHQFNLVPTLEIIASDPTLLKAINDVLAVTLPVINNNSDLKDEGTEYVETLQTENSSIAETVLVSNSDAELKEKEISQFLDSLDAEIEQWHNPYLTDDASQSDQPVTLPTTSFNNPQTSAPTISDDSKLNVKNDKREPCYFFERVGACRFGDSCSKLHEKPTSSRTLLLPSMFNTFAFDIASRASRSNVHGDSSDLALEHSDEDLYEDFEVFYDDVFPEFNKFGHVEQLKVCCNRDQHLRGNVYVQYATVSQAETAFQSLNGRFYGGKLLQCMYVTILSWSSAICGLYCTGRPCPRGGHCNFLHVFADKRSKDRSGSCTRGRKGLYKNKRLSFRISRPLPRIESERSARHSPDHNKSSKYESSYENESRSHKPSKKSHKKHKKRKPEDTTSPKHKSKKKKKSKLRSP